MIERIRNFAIIAHIDHGKSTISDRIIEYCGAVEARQMKNQILDSMDIERERGITIKSQTIRLKYSLEGQEYVLNLMDTPGHVDFSYEVSRCLAACEGALLVVDASQGVEAQTLANAYKAIDEGLEIIPVLNKIDLPSADVERCKKEIEDIIGIKTSNAVLVSGKTGDGIPALLEELVYTIPAPKKSDSNLFKAMLVDAFYDQYVGIVILIRIVSGSIKAGDRIKMMSTNSLHVIEAVGVFTPKRVKTDSLSEGEIGFCYANIKKIDDCLIGDTIIAQDDSEAVAMPGFKQIKPVVFCGLYPVDTEDYQVLKDSLAKLCLNDSSISYEYESSKALGFGFRCGFLGMLHMEITQERLSREFDLSLVVTVPSVLYKVINNNGEEIEIHSPADFPDPSLIKSVLEPIADVSIVLPQEYAGEIINLCVQRRGVQIDARSSSGGRIIMKYKIPMAEIVSDFHDRLKSVSKGYASFEYDLGGYEEAEIVKVGILINGEAVDALSILTHKSRSEHRGRKICEKLKDFIPRQMFAIPIQAAIGGKIIARETISAYRKDVTSKCYGGDISRKRKLLDKQKKGKKKMKMMGSVEVPQDVFLAVLKADSE